MQISEAQHKTAGELVDLIAKRLGSGRAVHPQTAIASSARLAGSLLLRSFNFNIQAMQPGSVVLSDEANEQGPKLVSIFGSMLQHFGVQFDPAKAWLGSEIRRRPRTYHFAIVVAVARRGDGDRAAQNHRAGGSEIS